MLLFLLLLLLLLLLLPAETASLIIKAHAAWHIACQSLPSEPWLGAGFLQMTGTPVQAGSELAKALPNASALLFLCCQLLCMYSLSYIMAPVKMVLMVLDTSRQECALLQDFS